MKTKEFGIDLSLSPESIDLCSEKIETFLTGIGTEKKEIIRIRISAEDILLKWQKRFGTEKQIKLSCYHYLGQPTVQLKLEDDPFDPLTAEGGELDDWSRKLLSGLQVTPVYHYAKNTNIVSFKLIKKRKSPLFWILIALAASAAVGGLGLLLPEDVRETVTENLMTPLCTTYLNVLNFFCIPLIFLSVALGICGVGDASSFGKIGKRMIGHFALTLLIVTAITTVTIFPLFPFSFGSGSVSFNFRDFLDMFLGFFPTSLVTPFIDCNAMQLIIMGVIIGVAILKLNPIAKTMSAALDDLNGVLVLISQWFTRLIPFFVFTIIVKSVWAGEIGEILSASKSWVITIGMQLIMLALMAIQICIRHKVRFGVLIKKVVPTFLIALGTNSCGATIPEIYSGTAKLGVSPSISGFGIPIGTSVFKPSTAVRLVALSYFFAVSEGITVSPEWFVMVVLMSMILSVAIPAIPGGTLIFCPMLFSQLGIPVAAATAMLATDFFFDAPCTGFCMVSTEFALVQQAGKLNLLDEEALRKKV